MKKVRKLIPVSLYDIPGMEQWLEEQANQGLFPEHLGSWATFRTGAVPGTRFRLDAFVDTPPVPFGKSSFDPSGEQLELYRQAGWEYAFSVGRAYFLFYTADPAAPELYSDWESRGLSLDRLTRQVRSFKRRRVIAYGLVLLMLLAALFWPASRFDVQPDRWARLPLLLIYLFDPVLLLFLTVGFFFLQINRRDYRTLLSIYQHLKDGLPPPPSSGPSRKIVRENMVTLLVTPVFLLVLLLSWKVDKSTPLENLQLPYLPISELEGEYMSTHEKLFGYNDRFSVSENQGLRHFSLLAPVWYEVDQRGYSLQSGTQLNAFSPDPQDGKYRYAPHLDMTYFHLALPILSRPTARAQMDLYRLVNLRWTYEELDYPGADFVILATEPDGLWQMAAAAKGGRVAVFRYAGLEQLADHLDLLVELVQQE